MHSGLGMASAGKGAVSGIDLGPVPLVSLFPEAWLALEDGVLYPIE